MSETSSGNKAFIFPIVLTTLINMLAIGIIIPVIAPLIIDNTTGLFDTGFPERQRHIVMGLLTACFPLAQFFGAPVLGTLSDQYGRKPILLVSMAGSAVGFALFAIAIRINSLELMFGSRLFDGFTGGNLSVVYSAMSDISDARRRARNFGLIGMTFGIGFVLGPMTGGLLSSPDIVSWFNEETPFWVTALMFAAGMVMAAFWFPETNHNRRVVSVNPFSGIIQVAEAFRYSNLRAIFTALFFQTLGFSFFVQFFQVFLVEKHHYDSMNIGYLFGYVGLFIAFTQGGLVRLLTKVFSSFTLARITNFTLAISIPFVLLPDDPAWIFAVCPFIAISQGTLSPNMTAVVSFQARPEQQGKIMGINQSILSLGQAVPPIAAGILSSFNVYYPTVASSIFVFAGALVLAFFGGSAGLARK